MGGHPPKGTAKLAPDPAAQLLTIAAHDARPPELQGTGVWTDLPSLHPADPGSHPKGPAT